MTKNANILIVDDDERLALDLKKFLNGQEDIQTAEYASSVAEATETLQAIEVDVIILDLIMPVNDGYYLLESLPRIRLRKNPAVIVTSAISHERAIKRAFDLGARYYMIKPYKNEIIYNRIFDVLETDIIGQQPETPQRSRSLDQRINEIFLPLGIPPHLKGYNYLREAVKMVLKDYTLIYSITKRLYPAIAQHFDVTPTKVELAIRHTLEVAWQRNHMENLSQVFGCDIYLKGTKPTNGEFIALVADKIATEGDG